MNLLDDVRNKILLAAKQLFASQGYKKTTIRQIVEKSGILIGSIYHFFENKEDIFEAIVLDLFNRCEALVNEHLSENESPSLKYALMCAIELKAVEMNELVCEFYYEAYSSNKILNKIAVRAAQRSEALFKEYNPDYTSEDYYARTLMIKGAVRSCIASRYFKQDIEFNKMVNAFLEISLHAFNVNQTETEQVIRCVGEMQKDIYSIAEILGEESHFL